MRLDASLLVSFTVLNSKTTDRNEATEMSKLKLVEETLKLNCHGRLATGTKCNQVMEENMRHSLKKSIHAGEKAARFV